MDSHYDEFGNYIGPELSDDSDSDGGADANDQQVRSHHRRIPQDTSPAIPLIQKRESPICGSFPPLTSPRSRSIRDPKQDDPWNDRPQGDADNGTAGMDVDGDDAEENFETAIVLAEDKKYYPTAEEVYGPGTETLIMDEDAQPLEEPIIAPVKKKQIEADRGKNALELKVSEEYLRGLMGNANLVRNVAVAGHLHHGKTTLFDMLVEQTHHVDDAIVHADDRALRYTDTRLDEQDREVSIKAVPMSLVMPNGAGKHLLFNMMDTPGHVNFSDEVTASYRLSDGVMLVVDAVEGVMCGTERLIKHAAKERLPICVFVNKVDRLILELKLPPADAYHKIRHTLEEINAIIEATYGGRRERAVRGSSQGERVLWIRKVRLVLHPQLICEALRGYSRRRHGYPGVRAQALGRHVLQRGDAHVQTQAPAGRRRPLIRAVHPRAAV